MRSAKLSRAEGNVQTRIAFHSVDISQQSGIVLPVSLFMLLAATLMTLALVKANMISLRVGGVSVIAAETQAAAEVQLSSFFNVNSIALPDQKYYEHWSRCSAKGNNVEAADGKFFDCRDRTVGTTTVEVDVQALGVTNPPRSETPSSSEFCFNYHNIGSQAVDSTYGSRAEVGTGSSIMIPNPRKQQKCI